jgi:hydrogenase maturation factor
VVLELLMIAGVLAVAGPALLRGAVGLRRRSGHYSSDVTADRISLVLLVTGRLLTLLLVGVLSLVVLVSAVGAIVRDLQMPGLVSVFFVLDLLIAVLVVLTFGRRDRRRVRRRATPAAR